MKTTIKKEISTNKGYYLPILNLNGLVGSITPFFSGDLKKGFHNYGLEPISELGLYNLTNKRNMIFYVNGKRLDLNGQTDNQQNDKLEYEVNQLTQKIIRSNDLLKIQATSFVATNDNVEIHLISVVNNSNKDIELEAFTSIPMYSRSPENIHDHRHVTSLLNVVEVFENGIINVPTLTFDERGHKENNVIYSVFAYSNKVKVKNYVPIVDEYLKGGTFNFPKGLKSNKYNIGDVVKGFEAIGAMGFEKISLKPNEEVKFSLIIGIEDNINQTLKNANKYKDFNNILEEEKNVVNFYKEINNYINFNIESEARTKQLKWVTLQPILRRHLGNSYLPHHDYGRGGRGWRDLWQDLLSLIYSNDKTVKQTIIDNFAGVRIDGSNATIIGDNPGEFKADRNQIIRVWSDHGVWPLLTVKLYIDEFGDIEILNNKQKYFDDGLTHYSKKRSSEFKTDNILKYENGDYEGTILEHLILQNLVGFFNVGKHGFTRLEDADWNDGLDMASDKGETIPFTMFYLENLRVLANILENITETKIEIYKSLYELLNKEINLNKYFDLVSNYQGLNKILVDKQEVISKLLKLAEQREKTILDKAIIDNNYYQSYINNDGEFVDNNKTMSLTAQAMALMNNIPSKEFSKKVAAATKEKLFDKNVGGYRLNSDYKKVLTNMGRAYGFAYGHKENGAVFCHMATMYTYGLYNYNLVSYGHESIKTLLDHALKEESGVIAGVPEYFNEEGLGKYLFLTGTASWLIKLYREQIFGINMNYGKLTFNPKLTKEEFIEGIAQIETYIKGEKVNIKFINKKNLEYGKYQISKIFINKEETKMRMFETIKGNVEVHLDEIN